MFTGLVEEIGIVKSVIKGEKSIKIIIEASKVLEDVKLGDSIAVNGVCLTVTEYTSGNFAVDVMAETIRKSNLINLNKGNKINLERALRMGDRLGGHIVSGHIDGVGNITKYQAEDNAVWVSVSAPSNILKYIIQKGSIAIDGISLTVAYADTKIFKVSVIPHTKNVTTLLNKKIGDKVNLECDMIGKYIEKLINNKEEVLDKKVIDKEFLYTNGFA